MTFVWAGLATLAVLLLVGFAVLGRYDMRRAGKIAALFQFAFIPVLVAGAFVSEGIAAALAIGLIPAVILSLAVSGVGWLAGRIWRTEAL